MGTQFDRAYVLMRGVSFLFRRGKLITALRQAADSYAVKPDLDALLDRVTIVQGDISVANFGVSEAAMAELASAKIDQFWHYAASLNYEEPRDDQVHQH